MTGLFNGDDSSALYPVSAMNMLLAQRPQDAWAATIFQQAG
jgi:hypothetical protein